MSDEVSKIIPTADSQGETSPNGETKETLFEMGNPAGDPVAAAESLLRERDWTETDVKIGDDLVNPPKSNEYTDDGKYISKVNDPLSLKAVVGIGRSRNYIYFQDAGERSVVDREWYEEIVSRVEDAAHGYNTPIVPSENFKEVDEVVKNLEAMTSKAKALQDALTKEESDNASLKKALAEMNKAYTELKEKSDLQGLEIEELKSKVWQEETNKDSIPPPVAKDETDMKRLDTVAMQNVRRSQGYSNTGKCARFCRTCHECEVLDYKNHAIAMRCKMGDFPVGAKSGCNMDTGDGVSRIVLTDEAIAQMIKDGNAMKCGKCGKIIGWDEYAVNQGWCAACLDASYDQYMKEQEEAKKAAEKAKEMENLKEVRPFNLPYGGVCERCIYWHSAKCEKPMNKSKQKASCYTIRVTNGQRIALEQAMRESADGMIRMVEGRQPGDTTTLIDESGERVTTEYDESGKGYKVTTKEEGEW